MTHEFISKTTNFVSKFTKKYSLTKLPCQFRASKITKKEHCLQSSSSNITHLLRSKRSYSLLQRTQTAIIKQGYDARIPDKHLNNVNKHSEESFWKKSTQEHKLKTSISSVNVTSLSTKHIKSYPSILDECIEYQS